MEFLDVLDENGKKTGVVRNRELIYKNGDWHRTVHVWLLNSKNELLIQKRASNKETFPNLWAISNNSSFCILGYFHCRSC